MSAPMQVVESIRTMRDDQFNSVEYGYIPKTGGLTKSERYNYREADLTEAQTSGLDSTTFTQDIKLLIPEVINRQIITQAEDARVARNLVDVIRINGPTQSFLKEYGFRAQEVQEGSEVPVGKLRYEKFYINVIKVGVRPQLTYEAIADGNYDIFRRHTLQAALAMTKYEDAHIMSVLNAGVPDGSNIIGTVESDHSFAATANVLTWDLWIKADMAVQMEHLNVTDVVMHPYQAAQILKLEEYRNLADNKWNVFPDRVAQVVATGNLPPILGKRIWVTQNQTIGIILFLDNNNYGVLAERQPLLIETDKDIIHQIQTVVYTQRYGAGIVNNDGASNITGLKNSL